MQLWKITNPRYVGENQLSRAAQHSSIQSGGEPAKVGSYAFPLDVLDGEDVSTMSFVLENPTGKAWKISYEYAVVFGDPVEINRSVTLDGLTFGDIHDALVDAEGLGPVNYWANDLAGDVVYLNLMKERVTDVMEETVDDSYWRGFLAGAADSYQGGYNDGHKEGKEVGDS